MHASRWIPALAVVCAVGALSSCSGDDEPDPTSGGSPSASTSQEQEPPAESERRCKVEVAVTGDAEASWTGKGTSRTASSGPRATYTARQGDNQIWVYSDGEEFVASANVTIGQDTFTTPPGDSSGLTVKGSGRGAEVDADASGVEPGSAAHVTASFDC